MLSNSLDDIGKKFEIVPELRINPSSLHPDASFYRACPLESLQDEINILYAMKYRDLPVLLCKPSSSPPDSQQEVNTLFRHLFDTLRELTGPFYLRLIGAYTDSHSNPCLVLERKGMRLCDYLECVKAHPGRPEWLKGRSPYPIARAQLSLQEAMVLARHLCHAVQDLNHKKIQMNVECADLWLNPDFSLQIALTPKRSDPLRMHMAPESHRPSECCKTTAWTLGFLLAEIALGVLTAHAPPPAPRDAPLVFLAEARTALELARAGERAEPRWDAAGLLRQRMACIMGVRRALPELEHIVAGALRLDVRARWGVEDVARAVEKVIASPGCRVCPTPNRDAVMGTNAPSGADVMGTNALSGADAPRPTRKKRNKRKKSKHATQAETPPETPATASSSASSSTSASTTSFFESPYKNLAPLDTHAEYQRTFRPNSTDPSVHLRCALFCMHHSRWKEASAHLERALKLRPHREICIHLGGVYKAIHQHRRAFACYDRALSMPGHQEHLILAHINYSSGLIELKRYREVIEHCNQALALSPPELVAVRILDLLVEASIQLGQVHEVLPHIARLLAERPEDLRVRLHYAMALMGNRQLMEAREQYRLVLERDAEYRDYSALTAYLITFLMAGQLSEAAGALAHYAPRGPALRVARVLVQHVERMGPGIPRDYVEQLQREFSGMVEQRLRDQEAGQDKAKEKAKAQTKTPSGGVQVQHRAGRGKRTSSGPQLARNGGTPRPPAPLSSAISLQPLAECQAALRADPCNPHLHFQLGLHSTRAEQYQEAIGHYQRALDIAPRREYYLNMGNCYCALDQPQRAFECYDRAVQAPGTQEHYVLAQLNYSDALLEAHRHMEAITHCEQALKVVREMAAPCAHHAHILAHLIEASLQLGETARCLPYFEQYFALDDNPPLSMQHNSALVLTVSGQHERAMEQFRRALTGASQRERERGDTVATAKAFVGLLLMNGRREEAMAVIARHVPRARAAEFTGQIREWMQPHGMSGAETGEWGLDLCIMPFKRTAVADVHIDISESSDAKKSSSSSSSKQQSAPTQPSPSPTPTPTQSTQSPPT